MAEWAKPKFFWKNMLGTSGSTLTVTSTESDGDYDIDYIHNTFEVNMWKATSSSGQHIIYDAGVGLINNGDFETGDTTGWSINVGGSGAAVLTVTSSGPHSGTYRSNVAISDGGSDPTHVSLQTTGNDISIIKGKEYKVRHRRESL